MMEGELWNEENKDEVDEPTDHLTHLQFEEKLRFSKKQIKSNGCLKKFWKIVIQN